MPTPTELARAERANIVGVPEPWRYTNGQVPNMRPQPATEPADLTLKQLREKRDVFRNLSRREQERLTYLERREAERKEAEFNAEMAPIRAQQERELEMRRRSGYQDWLAELTNSNTEIQKLDGVIESLSQQLTDAKAQTMFEPHTIDQILAHAEKLPVLREAVPLLESEIQRCESSVHEWTTYGEGIARRVHEDLAERISGWRALRISELRTKIHQDLLNMFGSEPAPQLLDGILKDSQEYKVLQSAVTLPDKDSLNVDEWNTAIGEVEALTDHGKSVVESSIDIVAEAPHETNRTKRRPR